MPTKREETATVADARAAMILDNENEYRRLLYVAMTRAADRLIVCGSIGQRKMLAGCWYDLIKQGLEADGPLSEEPGDIKDMNVKRFRKFTQETGAVAPAVAPAKPLPGLADESRGGRSPAPRTCCGPPAPAEDERRAFGGQGVERRRALARGTHVHRLMQSLPDVPPARRAEAARRYLARQKRLDDAERSEIAEHTLRLLGDLRFDKLFLPGSRAEVSIVGHYRRAAGVRPGGPAGGDAGRSADRRLQDQPAGAAQPRRGQEAPCGLRKAARALSRGAGSSSIPAGRCGRRCCGPIRPI